MHDLDFGASIIDTPGIKGFGLVELEFNQIEIIFQNFLHFKKYCKFHNCIHKDEPDCAVKKNLAIGKIAESRYKNYLNMLEEDGDRFRTNFY